MEPGIIIPIAVAILIVTAMLISNARRRKHRGPARHEGAYVPRKDRWEIRGATNHSAVTDFVGPRSSRFPEMERR